jgi:exopolysaccharide biosynthesis protein
MRRLLLTVRSFAVVGVVAVLLAVSNAGVGSARGRPARFVTVAPGIAHATFEVQSDGAETFSGHAFNVDLDVADLRLLPAGGPSSRRPVAEIVAAYPAVVAINASFFDTDGSAMGLAVDGGRVMAGGKRRSWGALVISDRDARIVLGAEIKDDFAHRLVVQGIPRFVVGGKVQPLKPQVAERTAVCARGNVVVLVVSTKVEATPFARFLADPPDQGGLGCWDALNLDGGPSTQLVAKLPALSLSLPGGWGVPNALVVVPRQM